jgi:hypothetical protein
MRSPLEGGLVKKTLLVPGCAVLLLVPGLAEAGTSAPRPPNTVNVAVAGQQLELWPYTAFTAVNSGKLLPFIYPWRHLDAVQITGVFGWPAVPLAVKQASLIAAADLFKLKDAPFGVAGISDLGAIRVKDNPMITRLLARYMSGDRVGV